MCIDFRVLNQQIRLDKYLLLRLDDLLDKFLTVLVALTSTVVTIRL